MSKFNAHHRRYCLHRLLLMFLSFVVIKLLASGAHLLRCATYIGHGRFKLCRNFFHAVGEFKRVNQMLQLTAGAPSGKFRPLRPEAIFIVDTDQIRAATLVLMGFS